MIPLDLNGGRAKHIFNSLVLIKGCWRSIKYPWEMYYYRSWWCREDQFENLFHQLKISILKIFRGSCILVGALSHLWVYQHHWYVWCSDYLWILVLRFVGINFEACPDTLHLIFPSKFWEDCFEFKPEVTIIQEVIQLEFTVLCWFVLQSSRKRNGIRLWKVIQ